MPPCAPTSRGPSSAWARAPGRRSASSACCCWTSRRTSTPARSPTRATSTSAPCACGARRRSRRCSPTRPASTSSCAVADRAVAKMREAGVPAAAIESFRRRRARVGEGLVRSDDLEPVRDLPRLDDLPAAEAPLDGLVVIKLNGGLATTMGLRGPKSLVEVRPGLSFLAAVVRQTRALRVPLLLMSSAATAEPTRRALPAVRQFLQSVQPKLDAETLEPVSWPADPALEWCPPGHGEVYSVLGWTGVLADLRERGFRYAFISNVDNLAAAVEPRIPAWMAAERVPFVMEVVEGTGAERKGGHIARRAGRYVLRETAQTPPGETASFRDFRRWPS